MNKPKFSCLVTGTDTEIGKTLVASSLLRALARTGVRAAGMKPVSAGAIWRDGRWHNEDVDSLATQSNLALPAELVAPYLFRQPTAPHIAAASEGQPISLSHILDCYRQIAQLAEAVVVEGVGGFRVPLDDSMDTADMAQRLGLPVVLVVGLRLGAINHSLLTVEAIAARGLHLAGWVVNTVEPDLLNTDATVATLAARIDAPMLGRVPRFLGCASSTHEELVAAADRYLDFSRLPGWPATMS